MKGKAGYGKMMKKEALTKGAKAVGTAAKKAVTNAAGKVRSRMAK